MATQVVRRTLFLGPPGVGKSTYASRVAAFLGVPHISVGDLVRAQITQGTALGRQFAERVNNGKFVEDELANRLLSERLAQPDARNGWVLDGFPRTAGQAVSGFSLGTNLCGLLVSSSLSRELGVLLAATVASAIQVGEMGFFIALVA